MFIPMPYGNRPEDWEIVIGRIKYKLVEVAEKVKEDTPMVSRNERVIKLRSELAELRNKLK
jgi:polyhydroxyalkanoate synthesis regulator phasin